MPAFYLFPVRQLYYTPILHILHKNMEIDNFKIEFDKNILKSGINRHNANKPLL